MADTANVFDIYAGGELSNVCALDFGALPFLQALPRWIHRLPDAATGLDYWEERLLAHCSASARAASNVIADVAVEGRETDDCADLNWLFTRLLGLSDPTLARASILAQSRRRNSRHGPDLD
jgi:hypothetical protein